MRSADVDLLLTVLNSTPVVDGRRQDRLPDPEAVDRWLSDHGPVGTGREHTEVVRARDLLQDVARGVRPSDILDPLLHGVARTPSLRDGAVRWTLQAPDHRRLAVRAVLAWAEVTRLHPGRLRLCANEDCGLFLLDRSRGNTARWCSMAACGNRLKARRHHGRTRDEA